MRNPFFRALKVREKWLRLQESISVLVKFIILNHVSELAPIFQARVSEGPMLQAYSCRGRYAMISNERMLKPFNRAYWIGTVEGGISFQALSDKL